MIEPSAALVVGLIVGGGLGVIAGGLFASGRLNEWRERFDEVAAIADAAIDERDEAESLVESLQKQIVRLCDNVEALIRRNREYALERDKIAAQRRAAGDKGRATQAANRAAEKAKSDELHESMRAGMGVDLAA